MRLGTNFFAALVLSLASGACLAADFIVTPVRMFMNARDRALAVTIANGADEEVVIQSEVFTWRQTADGQEDLTPTDDLVLSPPIAKIGPKSRQVLRLVRSSPPPTDEQKTYRIMVREVPEAKPIEGTAMRIALSFSMPIFVTPANAKRSIDCKVSRVAPDRLTSLCQNKGNAYAFFRSISVLGSDGKSLADLDGSSNASGYVLPRMQRAYDIKGTSRIPGGKLKLQVTYDDFAVEAFDIELAE